MTEFLPDRFDSQGRPLDRGNAAPNPFSQINVLFGSSGGRGGEGEMVERLVQDFTGVLDGRKSWKDMLRGLAEGVRGSGGGGKGERDDYGEGGNSSRRKR